MIQDTEKDKMTTRILLSDETKKGLTTSHITMQLDFFASKLMVFGV